ERDVHLKITVNGEQLMLRDIDRDIDLTAHLKVLVLVNGEVLGTQTDRAAVLDLKSLNLTLVVNGVVLPSGSITTGTDTMGNLVIVVPNMTPNIVTNTAAPAVLPGTSSSLIIVPQP